MFTYTLDGNACDPKGEWEVEYERNDGQIFHRKKLKGELIFTGDDYDYIMALADCTEVAFVIYCNGEEYWTGYFIFPVMCYFDLDQCYVKVTPEVNDAYRCIMDNYDTNYNLQAPGGVTVQPEMRTCAGVLMPWVGHATARLPIMRRLWEYVNHKITGVQQMNCSLTCKSSFFENDNFPNGDNYAAAYNTDNYIMGTAPYANNNRLLDIFMLHNNYLKFSFSNGADACNGLEILTFKFLESVLRDRFNAYWYIDQNGEFRVEHLHFFDEDFAHSDFTDAIDLTGISAACLPSLAHNTNKLSFMQDLLYDKEIWTWQHFEGTEGTVAHGADFAGDPIYYGATQFDKYGCVPGAMRVLDWATPNLWSDIEWAHGLSAAGTTSVINCPGYCIIEVDQTYAPTRVKCDTGRITGVNNINAFLSTANLMEYFHLYGRCFLTGTMNGSDATPVNDFITETRKIIQDEIEFPFCCGDDFNPLNFITTEYGTGAIHGAVYNRLKNSLKVKLKYR